MSEFESTLRELLAAGHAARFRAEGDSMYPVIRSGDYLHVIPCRTPELRKGNVVLASTGRGLSAHRIVRVSERDGRIEIVTRGDNALRSDLPLAPDAILGQVARVECPANLPNSIRKSATIIRFAAVLVRRLRLSFSAK